MDSDKTGDQEAKEAEKGPEGKLVRGATRKLRLVPKPERKCLIDTKNPSPERIKIHEENLRRMAERHKINKYLMRQGKVIWLDEERRRSQSKGTKKT